MKMICARAHSPTTLIALIHCCSFVNFVDVHQQPRKSFKVMGYCPQALHPKPLPTTKF